VGVGDDLVIAQADAGTSHIKPRSSGPARSSNGKKKRTATTAHDDPMSVMQEAATGAR
jgi:hypothetical protein